MNKEILKQKINEEKSVLLIEKLKNKYMDYSQIYYSGAIKCLEEFPVNENIIYQNNWIKEKRIEYKQNINSDWYEGFNEGLEIISNILNKLLYED